MRAGLIISIVWAVTTVQALNPIVIKGHKFFDSVTKNQVFIKGVAYQPRSDDIKNRDPLSDASACARDASLMAKIGMNVVRVYEIDPRKNHDACMKSFADNGIYLLLDIATPKFSVNRNSPEYDVNQYQSYTAAIDAFGHYDNIFAFIAGNEVTNDRTNTHASPYVKAVIRDTKNYIKETQKRKIPVGYASNDDEFIRGAIKDYFACGDSDTQADFFGVNLYEWCGDSTFQKSGFADRTKEFETYSKPVFLSEYGCNLVSPRKFGEVAALYGPDMTDVWSGGVVYEWTQENNNYGLVKIDSSTGKVELLPDYNNLQNALAKANPKGVTLDNFNDQRAEPDCPANDDSWKASVALPPTPSEGACECMQNNLACVASDKVSNTDATSMLANSSSIIGIQIDSLCGMVSCNDIGSNGETGHYGAYSFCPPESKLSWLYSLYVQDNQASRCDFNGFARQEYPKRNDIGSCSKIGPTINSSGREAIDAKKSAAAVYDPNVLISSTALMTIAIFAYGIL
ncbi:Glucanosyltransferase-domain-containing protein [Phycomyces nitens]|nr:Glucanosyltransferase-domain-containing protein [Phycomyces nitens]